MAQSELQKILYKCGPNREPSLFEILKEHYKGRNYPENATIYPARKYLLGLKRATRLACVEAVLCGMR